MTFQNNTTLTHLLTLRNIASWQLDGIENGPSEITARPPSLQRGAVWEPQQIEMLWDSIMRGFPIGSIVIAKRIKDQNDRRGPASWADAVSGQETSHHILDGQQRCNAIAWGFADPWKKGVNEDVVLWLDLKPGNLLKNTTRKYLFRITTKAHPWGFHHGDSADTLRLELREKFRTNVETLYKNSHLPLHFIERIKTQDINRRPSPSSTLPIDANFPLPLFLIFKHFKNGKLDWKSLFQEEWIQIVKLWTGDDIINLSDEDRKEIELGMRMAEQVRLIPLLVPDALKSIDDIENIFQRLNRQGTPLDNEELVYSMIKAYWPKIDDVMSRLQFPPISEVRLVNLGVRVAMTPVDSKKLAPELTVDRIRKIFSPTDEKSVEDINARQTIENYFESNNQFLDSLSWINTNILYDKEMRPYGLPAYLRSSIAWSSRELFAWLMLLAKRHDFKPIVNSRKIIGLTLVVHWFGLDKAKAVDKLIGNSDLTKLKISDLNEDNQKKNVLIPLTCEELKQALQLHENSGPEQLSKWTSFWQGSVVRDSNGDVVPETKAIELGEKYGRFLEKLRQEKELLVYAQREYIEEVFVGFDPSNKLMWKGHNRPWDYDHILASAKLDARGIRVKLQFDEVCRAWQQSIGNQVAVDFSFNRSAQDVLDAVEKYKTENSKKKGITVFADDAALEYFKLDLLKLQIGSSMEPALGFVLAARNRLINIYREWYDSLIVDQSDDHARAQSPLVNMPNGAQ